MLLPVPAVITLAAEQREAVKQHGTPLPIFDDATQSEYVLLSIKIAALATGEYLASIRGIAAYGEGATEHEATLALIEALRQYIEAFG
jgi:hypothetical protein